MGNAYLMNSIWWYTILNDFDMIFYECMWHVFEFKWCSMFLHDFCMILHGFIWFLYDSDVIQRDFIDSIFHSVICYVIFFFRMLLLVLIRIRVLLLLLALLLDSSSPLLFSICFRAWGLLGCNLFKRALYKSAQTIM